MGVIGRALIVSAGRAQSKPASESPKVGDFGWADGHFVIYDRQRNILPVWEASWRGLALVTFVFSTSRRHDRLPIHYRPQALSPVPFADSDANPRFASIP